MKRAAALSVAVVISVTAGCGGQGEPAATPSTEVPAPSATAEPEKPSPTPTTDGAQTIEDVWAKIGCSTDDPTGTRGILDITEAEAPVVSTGTCTPYEDGGMVFFFQLPSADDVPAWLDSGALEVGATDALYTDGAVVILATDAGTAQEFETLFTPAG